MLHPQLLRHGLHLWVSRPVAHFSSDLLAGHLDVFRKIDLLFLYQQMLRLRSQIAANKSRVLNAYEEGISTSTTSSAQFRAASASVDSTNLLLGIRFSQVDIEQRVYFA